MYTYILECKSNELNILQWRNTWGSNSTATANNKMGKNNTQ